MQTKVLSLPSFPPSSPSPNPNDPAADPLAVGYSLKFRNFLLILVIVFIVFISCDSVWSKLIDKLNTNPYTTTSSARNQLQITSGVGSTTVGVAATTQRGLPLPPPPPRISLPPINVPQPRPPPTNFVGCEGDHNGRVAAAANRCSECVICLKEFRYSDLCRVLPDCNHTFHASCIDGWIMINQTCPICRSSVQVI